VRWRGRPRHDEARRLTLSQAKPYRVALTERGQIGGAYVTSTGDIDLTAQLPWLTNPDQVVRVQSGWSWPYRDLPFDVVKQAGHVLLAGSLGYVSPGALWLSCLRPAWTWVNGAESTSGPTQDTDTLEVDLDYAASAGHIEAWHLFPSHMFAAAAGNLQATQQMAAAEFTRQSLIWGPPPSRSIAFSEIVSLPLVG